MNNFNFLLTLIISLSSFQLSAQYERYISEVFEKVDVQKNVIYGSSITQSGIKQDLILDIYVPKGDELAERPIVIFAHGGFFFFGEKEGFEEECRFLARSGYIAVSIDYRLIDVDTLGQAEMVSKRAVIDAIYDMKAAVRYFRKDAYTENIHRIDTNNIFIGGYSAGAITSLHYAYANTTQDVLEMGGEAMLRYVMLNGGLEGISGNPGYSSRAKGVINISGSLHSAEFVDKDEAILFSVHGTEDAIVPYSSGVTGTTTVKTEGSSLIHAQADKIGLINKLYSIKGGDHFSFRYNCRDCKDELRKFLFENL